MKKNVAPKKRVLAEVAIRNPAPGNGAPKQHPIAETELSALAEYIMQRPFVEVAPLMAVINKVAVRPMPALEE